MKRFFLFICLFFICGNVHALSYSDYSDFSNFSSEYVGADDLTDVITERRYLFYKFEKIYGPLAMEESEEFPFLEEACYYGEESEPSTDKPEMVSGRIIKEYNGYHYLKKPAINYVKISSDMDVNLSEFIILNNGVRENFDVSSDNLIEFDGIDYDKFKFVFKVDVGDLEVNFDVTLGNDNTVLSVIRCNYWRTSYDYIDKSLFFIHDDMYEDVYSLEKLDLILKENVTFYSYKDCFKKSYKLNKVYTNDYYVNGFDDFIYKDEDKFIDFYAYRTRSILPDNSLENNILEDGLNNEVSDLKEDAIDYDIQDSFSSNNFDVTPNVLDINSEKLTNNLDLSTDSVSKVIYDKNYVALIFSLWILLLFLLIFIIKKRCLKKETC